MMADLLSPQNKRLEDELSRVQRYAIGFLEKVKIVFDETTENAIVEQTGSFRWFFSD